MGNGDLNNKKSWHTKTVKNQERVWLAETKAVEERKKIQQLLRDRQQERDMEAIQRLQEEAGGIARPKRVDWMYTGASNSVTGISQEQESYLLGKRRVDDLVLKQDKNAGSLGSMVKVGDAGVLPAGQTVSNTEMLRMAAADPLAEIERRRKAKIEEMAAREMRLEKIRSRDKERSRRHRHHRQEEDEDRHRHHKRRRYSDERSRSRSPRRHHRDERYESRRHRSRRYDSQDDSRSPSPYRHRDRRDRDRDRAPEDKERRYHDRDRDSRRSDRYPYDSPYKSRNVSDITPKSSQSSHSEDEDAKRVAKLAAMQSAANDLEQDRDRRLREMEERDAIEKAGEDEERMRGGRAFKSTVYEQASKVGLSDRLRGPGKERFEE